MSLDFLFAVHNHQPVGNFPSVFQRAFNDCYRPFLEEIEKHPAFKLAIHFSGPLWEYMEEHEKDCWETIRRIVGRGQAELLSGGFYEPILSIIPEEDRIGQIRLMNRFIEDHFGVKPRGLWLTERVWEPHLPKSLAEAGIEYTLLDEEHFHYAGIGNIHASYMTEEEGRPLRLFPIDKKLRYLIPFRPLDEIRAHFGEIESLGGAAILGDDGEKFGLWPGTHDWVYEKGWLRKFLEFIESEASGVRMSTFSEYCDAEPPGGRVYLPPASYEEMMEWALEPGDFDEFRAFKEALADRSDPASSRSGRPLPRPSVRRFVRGGYFRDFFLKYPEVNHLHKRMLLVSREIRESGRREGLPDLYKGQCNDPYWHGIFGGVYLPHLRESAYSHLLKAENRVPLEPGWEETDFDLDGYNEIILRSKQFTAFFKPSYGGALTELDYRPLSRNMSDVLARRRESYHRPSGENAGSSDGASIHELAKKMPPGAEDILRYDWHPRYSLLDHFLHPDTTLEKLSRVDYGEQGDFVNRPFRRDRAKGSLLLERDGHVWAGNERLAVTVRKKVTPVPEGLHVVYEIENRSAAAADMIFASEWNFYLLEDEIEEREGVFHLLRGRLALAPSGSAELWRFPLRTLSQSEGGYDIIHQGFCLLPVWNIQMAGGGGTSFQIELKEMRGS